jgi:hypothetical protein
MKFQNNLTRGKQRRLHAWSLMKSCKSFEVFWSLLRSSEVLQVFWSLLKSHEVFWSLMKSFEVFWSLMKSFEVFWSLLKSYEVYWSLWSLLKSLKSIEVLWSLLKSHEVFWSLMKSFEVYWNLLKSTEIFWSLSKSFEKTEVSLVEVSWSLSKSWSPLFPPCNLIRVCYKYLFEKNILHSILEMIIRSFSIYSFPIIENASHRISQTSSARVPSSYSYEFVWIIKILSNKYFHYFLITNLYSNRSIAISSTNVDLINLFQFFIWVT